MHYVLCSLSTTTVVLLNTLQSSRNGVCATKSARESIGRASGSRYMARLRATGADLGTGHTNNIRWMTVVTSD